MQELCEVTKSDGDCCYSDNGDYNVCQNYNEIQDFLLQGDINEGSDGRMWATKL